MADETTNGAVKEKKRRKATLNDIKPIMLNVEIDDIEVDENGEPVIGDDGEPEGVTLEYSLKVPAFFRWQQIGNEVPDPAPPTMGVDGNKRPIYDTNSWSYRVGLNEAANERNIRRLAESLTVPEIPGDTIAEKAQWIKDNMTPGVVGQLTVLLMGAANRGEARIANRANTFQ